VRVYGGRARRLPADCLIAPLPQQLEDVSLTGGGAAQNSLVRLSWRAVRPPTGARIRVYGWDGTSCGAGPPRRAYYDELPPSATSWKETQPATGPWCYAVQISNRYGAAQPAVARSVVRVQPVPDPPVVTAGPVFVPELVSHRFRAQVPGGASLVSVRDYGNPARCVSDLNDPDAFAETLYVDDDGGYTLAVERPTECVVLFAVDDETGLAGAGVVLRLVVPAPTAAPTVGEVRVNEWGDHVVHVSLGANPQGYQVGYDVRPGGCPSSVDLETAERAYVDDDVYLSAYEPGPYCAVFALVDVFERTGPVVSRLFTVNES
jgi:hypothetical protein